MSTNSNDKVIRKDNGQCDEMANALRALAMDAVQQANSGHPGAPMGMAEMAVALWNGHLCHNPANPAWPDRDRFVLSNGHASMLLYGLLHLSGYDLPMAELQRFRRLHGKTPGHPEVGLTPGVETTTGPLGQGLTNAVGFALAEKLLADEFNRAGHDIVDHYSYVFLGDGCLREGISHEACALAGVWQLNKLIALYDDNGISIDGAVQGWFIDDTAARFLAYGWDVIGPVDGHDVVEVGQAIAQAKTFTVKPTLIICRTTIGKGSPQRAGTAKAHGEPLGAEEIRHTREAITWPYAAFEIPDSIAARWSARQLGAKREAQWQARFGTYRVTYPALANEFERRVAGELPKDLEETVLNAMASFGQSRDAVASRKASQQVLAVLAPRLPELLGGSADLTGSNLTDFPGCGAVRGGEKGGRHINYGVREFGMAALMKPRVIHVFTHDSIGLGEDGPTHQPVEHAASLRLIPNLDVWRPCDVAETAVAWTQALAQADRPTALLLSRQNLPAQVRSPAQVEDIRRGGYVLSDRPDAVVAILATGSEVSLAMAAQQLLDARNIAVRVVSLPSSTLFDRQERVYRDGVLGRGLVRIGVEAGVTRWWGQYGCSAALGIDTFGESAPAPQVYEHFGLTAGKLADLVQAQCDEECRHVRSSN